MSTLKEYTRAKHDEIENTHLSKLIMNKAISKTQWDLLVRQKAYIYELIERLIGVPESVKLASAVENDIETEPHTMLESTSAYRNHLTRIDRKQIDAHLYVHYMGEMFG